MEKPRRSVASIISFLPKRTGFSGDGNVHAQVLQQRRGFIVSIVPVEVRRKGKGGAKGEFEEPTSPKVTCMGQVKLRKMRQRCNSNRETKSPPPPAKPAAEKRLKSKRTDDASLFLSRIFRPLRRKAPAAAEDEKEMSRGDINPASAPALGTMRRYASGRETLRDFDWRNAEESGGEEEEDDAALVAHSGPIIVGSGGAVAMDPKKRPPPLPPIPLQL